MPLSSVPLGLALLLIASDTLSSGETVSKPLYSAMTIPKAGTVVPDRPVKVTVTVSGPPTVPGAGEIENLRAGRRAGGLWETRGLEDVAKLISPIC